MDLNRGAHSVVPVPGHAIETGASEEGRGWRGPTTGSNFPSPLFELTTSFPSFVMQSQQVSVASLIGASKNDDNSTVAQRIGKKSSIDNYFALCADQIINNYLKEAASF